MLISFAYTPGTIGPQLQIYAFQFIAQRNGWFITPEERQATGHFRWVDGLESIGIRQDSGKIVIDVPASHLNQILTRLKCDDTISPDEEPPPIEQPAVDEIVHEIQKKVIDYCIIHQQLYIYKLPWPQGKKMAVALTHDVDMTRKYGLKNLLKNLGQGHWNDFKDQYRQSVFKENVYWNFDELLQFYRQKKFRSTFFFLARAWENFQYRYQIRSDKFCRLFENILADGHEIGLHSSRYAFSHPDRILKEKRKLERVIGQPVYGVRQHYLRLQFPQAWRNFTAAGFNYDSSCGYNNAVGFRAGTSGIFHTFDYHNAQINSLQEIPILLMDYPWSSSFGSEEESKIIFQRLYQDVEKYQGVLNILWHPSNLAEPAFRDVWNNMFKWLKLEDTYLNTLGMIQQWWKNKSKLNLQNLRTDHTGYGFSLATESEINNLSLGIISSKKIKPARDLRQLNHDQYQFHLPPIRSGESEYFLSLEEDSR